MKNNLTIKYLRYDDEAFADVRALREAVFINEQGAVAEEEFDAYDKSALFILLLRDSCPVATARIAKTPAGFKIGRIVVDKSERGSGYGALVVNTAVEKAVALGAEEVLVDAQTHAVSFYEKLGFRIIGSELMDRGLVHIPMRRDFNERKEK